MLLGEVKVIVSSQGCVFFFLQVPNHYAPSLSWCTNTCESLCNIDGAIPCKSFPSLMFFCTKLSCKQGTADNAKLTVSLDRAGEVLPEQSCMEHFFFSSSDGLTGISMLRFLLVTCHCLQVWQCEQRLL